MNQIGADPDHEKAPSQVKFTGAKSSVPHSPVMTVDPDPEDEAAGDRASSEPADSPATSKGPAIKEVRSIEGLIRYAYSRSGRFSIPPHVREAIAAEDIAVADLRAVIEELAAQDPLLKVPVRLLAAIDRAQGSLKFRWRSLSAVALALMAHPQLQGVGGLDTALLYPEYGDRTALLAEVAGTLRADGPQSALGDSTEMREHERRELIENGISAVAMYLSIQREWTDADLVRELEAALRAENYRSARGRKRESTKALLIEASPAALVAISEAWRAEITAAEDRVATADRQRNIADQERETATGFQHSAEIETRRLRLMLAAREETIAGLRDAIAQEQRARRVQSSHAVNDYENLRTRMIRLLDRQLGLLEDGLHALRNGSASVTEEYLERVIEAFVDQANSLRDASGSGGDNK